MLSYHASNPAPEPSTDEAHAIRAGRGRWGDRDFPKAGWQVLAIEDLNRRVGRCEMCDASIRYAHHLTHPAREGDVMTAGCVCTGTLIGDLARARQDEALMRSRAGKRARWVARRWKRSSRGNLWLRDAGFCVTVYAATGGGYSAVVSRDATQSMRHLHRAGDTPDDAKLAAFDLITHCLAADATTANRR